MIFISVTINRAQKGGFFRYAAEDGIAIVFPDTSPRGAGVSGEDDSWDFGTCKFPILYYLNLLAQDLCSVGSCRILS